MRLDKQSEKYKKKNNFGACNKYYWIRLHSDEMGLFRTLPLAQPPPPRKTKQV